MRILDDLHYALRGLVAKPLFALVAIGTLALGIGANTAIYSLFDQMLLRPLPVQEPERLVNLSSPGPRWGSTSCNDAGNCDYVFSYPMFRDLEREQSAFTGIAAHRITSVNLEFRGQTRSGSGLLVSGGYFPVLGLKPALGRLLDANDDRTPREAQAVVLSHGYWESAFGADPGVIGETLVVNGRPLSIVGVAPRGFEGTTIGSQPLVFVPITMSWLERPGTLPDFERRNVYWAYLFARLKPGVSLEQARAALEPAYRAIINEVEAPLQTGASEQGMARFRAKPLLLEPGQRGQSSVPDNASLPLTLLFAVTVLVLLIACVNIANLLLARGAARAGEMAVRSSIGASQRRLVAQLLTEAALLALSGAVAALPVAMGTLALFATLLPDYASSGIDLALSPQAVVFAFAAAIVTALVFGLAPALQLARTAPISVLRGQGGQAGASPRVARFRALLATVQIAFSMVLLVLAGLFTQSLANVSRVELGIEVESLLTFSVAPERSGYTPERSGQLFDRIEQELAALPGATAATASMVPLLSGSNWNNNVSVEGFEAGPDTDTNASMNWVGNGFLGTLDVPLLAGRAFTDADAAGAPKVVIVNQRFAERFGLGRDAVGKRMAVGSGGPLDIEIVGLVPDIKYDGVKSDVPAQFWLPRRQGPGLGQMNFYVRTSVPPERMFATIRELMARLAPGLPVDDLQTMSQQVSENVSLDRFVSVLSAAFAILATLLAATGLYGLLSYTVAQRTREIGLRLALGAPPARLRGMVMRQVGWMALAGGGIGLAGAVFLGRAAESLLFGLDGNEPAILAGSVVVLALVVASAGYLPARRASRIDPLVALRYE